jgi:DNA (cytosine-5)-methyltransferase 1
MKDLDILELFSGIGGFSKGFMDAGYTIKSHQFSEIDKHAIANYKYNFKNAESIGSVTDVSGLKTPDVLTFGSPCQDFSLAGKRMGMGGERSSLITEAIRLISELRPAVFIWENVKGTFSSNNGEDFWAIIKAFANIGGYRLEWQLLNTSWFLPQNRERIYLIGHLDGRSEPGVFPISKNGGLFNKEGKARMNVLANLNSSQDGQVFDINGICQTLSAGHGNVPKIAGCLTAGGHSGGMHSDMTTISVATPGRKEKNQNGSRFKEKEMFCLTAEPHGVMMNKTSNYNSDVITDKSKKTFPCLRSGAGGKLKGVGLRESQNRIRRLTEIECERLQGFPDDWTKYGIYDDATKEISKTQRYKMCGNAVTVNVVKAIAERLNINL